jgi:hypothetical protein
MAKSKKYVRKHTNKTAFKKHQAGLKNRGAVIEKIEGMTIYYHFKD